MGLDMYLTGEAFYRHDHPQRKAKPLEIEKTIYRLAYWRKHPNLHGYIVNTFNKGIDDCTPIELTAKSLRQIYEAIETEKLPDTNGFFFGASAMNPEKYREKYGCTPEEALLEKEREKKEDLFFLRRAYEWLGQEEESVWKSVEYRASW